MAASSAIATLWPIPAYDELFPQDHVLHKLTGFEGMSASYKYRQIVELSAEISLYMLRTRGIPLTPEYFRRSLNWIKPEDQDNVRREFRAHNAAVTGCGLGDKSQCYAASYLNPHLESYFK